MCSNVCNRVYVSGVDIYLAVHDTFTGGDSKFACVLVGVVWNSHKFCCVFVGIFR